VKERACWRTRTSEKRSRRDVVVRAQSGSSGCFGTVPCPQLPTVAEPRYSGDDDVMLGCNEWLVGCGGLFLGGSFASDQTRETDRVFSDRV
jgi:hypothetical protein